MSSDRDDDATQRLEQLADAFAAELRAGARPSIDDYAARHPDLAADLRDLLPSVAALERHKVQELASTGRIGFLGLPSDQLDDFRIVREIGRGGMGVVYEAEQVSLGRIVALKTLPYAAFLSPAQVERFQREAETASRLQHPSIVPIHAVGQAHGVHYFAMQRIRGSSLDRVLQPATPDDDAVLTEARSWLRADGSAGERWRRIARVGAEVAEALEFAHRHGVLHRDVKPSNILLEPSGQVWVTDFGIAKIGDDGMTRTGEFLGTLQYAPPEQLDGHGDARSDVYGLGLCLFELAIGAPAFRSRSRRELADRIKNGLSHTPRQLDRSVPRDLDTIVAVATAFDPAHRYASAAQLAADLRRFATGMPIAARDVSSVERMWRWSGRNPVTATFAASTVLAAVAATAIGWYGYLSTGEALARERTALSVAGDNLQQAERATARAKSNLQLSLRSLNALFDSIAEDRQHGAADEMLLDMPAAPSLSRKEVDVLRQAVAFYEEFAAQNADDDALRLDTARALRRIGDLHQWTGALDDAEDAYRRAAEHYDHIDDDDPDVAVETAAIDRRRGCVAMERGQWLPAMRSFDAARSALADEVRDRPNDRNRRELVCTLNTIAAALSRQSMAAAGSRSRMVPMLAPAYGQAAGCCRQALQIAGELAAAHPESPTDLLLLARCHRLNAQTLALAPGRTRSAAAIAASMKVLGELAESQRDHAGYQYELAEANCLLGALAADAAAGLGRCGEGVAQARSLVATSPNAPVFQDLLARSLRRLGETRRRAGQGPAALDAFAEAATLRLELARRFPASPHHVMEGAAVAQATAALLRDRGDLTAARTQLESAIASVRGFGQGNERFMLTLMLLPDLHQELIATLEAAGDTAAAARVRAELPSMRPPFFRNGPFPGRGEGSRGFFGR